MLKASWGGGGRGMRVIRKENELENQINTARREAKSAFGKDDVFFEKLIEKAFHVEVQIIGERMEILFIYLKEIVHYREDIKKW